MVVFVRRASLAGAMSALRSRVAGLMPPRGAVDEWHSFYRAWRRNPRSIGAMAPSGRALARAITQPVEPGRGPVLELGSGTGVFSRALLARGVAEHALLLVERDPALAHGLRQQFPHAQVLQGDAAALASDAIWPRLRARPGTIVCGLPLLNMGMRQQLRVMQGAFSVLQPGGMLLLFTYGMRVPLRPAVLHRLGLKAVKIDTVMANVPPAHVWRVTRRQGHVRPDRT